MSSATMFDQVPNNKVVGILLGNDVDGLVASDPEKGIPSIFRARGNKVIDPGRFNLSTNDFSAQIAAFKSANAEVLDGILPFPTFRTSGPGGAAGLQAEIPLRQGVEFPSSVNSLGPRGKYLSNEVQWSPDHPFKSSLTGQSAGQFCDKYEEVTKKQWTQLLGFRHARSRSGSTF